MTEERAKSEIEMDKKRGMYNCMPNTSKSGGQGKNEQIQGVYNKAVIPAPHPRSQIKERFGLQNIKLSLLPFPASSGYRKID